MICSRDSFAFFPLRSLAIHLVHTVCSLFGPLRVCVCVLCPHCANIEKEKLRDLCFRFCFILFIFLSLHSFARSRGGCLHFEADLHSISLQLTGRAYSTRVCNRYANSRTTHQTVKLLSMWNIDFESRIRSSMMKQTTFCARHSSRLTLLTNW